MSIASEIERIKTNISNAYEVLEGKGAILPSQYQEVEYIESTGTQYINLNLNYSSNTDIEMKTDFFYNSSPIKYFFGARASQTSGMFNISCMNRMFEFRRNNANESLIIQNLTTPYIFKTNKTVWEINENSVEFNDIEFNFENTPLYLFMMNNNNTPFSNYAASAKVFYFKAWENGELIRNMLPCYRKSDNEAGLYDLVNGVFYMNSGTGQFTIGEEVDTARNSNNLSKFIDRLKVL